jgi:hypothetical protein
MILRALIVGQLVLLCAWFAAHTQLEGSLPVFLQKYLEVKRELEAQEGLDAVTWFALFGLVLYATSLIGVFLLKRWGRITFTAAIAYAVILSFFDEPTVATAFETAILSITASIDGFLLALVWFSPLSRWFMPSRSIPRQTADTQLPT